MPTGSNALPIEHPEQMAHWLVMASCMRAVMQGPFSQHHVNRHYWKRRLHEAMQ